MFELPRLKGHLQHRMHAAVRPGNDSTLDDLHPGREPSVHVQRRLRRSAGARGRPHPGRGGQLWQRYWLRATPPGGVCPRDGVHRVDPEQNRSGGGIGRRNDDRVAIMGHISHYSLPCANWLVTLEFFFLLILISIFILFSTFRATFSLKVYNIYNHLKGYTQYLSQPNVFTPLRGRKNRT
uniref:(northern house mosquito) hypothetical protein n=2 Tax=Culex pipiens TaxID=7175 RepID=A0A8D8H0K2_CULPI